MLRSICLAVNATLLAGGCVGPVQSLPKAAALLGASYRVVGTKDGGSLLEAAGRQASIFEAANDVLLVYPFKGGSAVIQANEVIVAGPPSLSRRLLTQKLADKGSPFGVTLRVSGQVPGRNLFLIRAEGGAVLSPEEVLELAGLEDLPGVTAEPNSMAFIAANQDRVDPRIAPQWAHQNIGPLPHSVGGKADADIDGVEALSVLLNTLPPPTRRPIVAVMDSGLDLSHPALWDTRWTNSEEIENNYKDDDGNGFIDDLNGWDFVNDIADPWDLDGTGHGTHVAGIIASRPRIAGTLPHGIAPFARLMPLRVVKKGSSGEQPLQVPLFARLSAIGYARKMGAEIINMSFESYIHSTFQEGEIALAHHDGLFVVAAAGNGLPNHVGKDVNVTPVYPCVTPSVICVAATDLVDALAPFSNYGIHAKESLVEIAAPGVDIVSLAPGGGTNVKSGTSMAAPLVAGTLAMLKSAFPNETYEDYRTRILRAADLLPALVGKIDETRRLNAYHAMFSKPRPPLGYNAYCNERVQTADGLFYPRWQNAPYANSGEAGMDGKTYEGAFRVCTASQLLAAGREKSPLNFRLAQDVDWASLGAGGSPLGDEPRRPGEPLQPFVGALHGDNYSVVGLRFRNRNRAALIAHLAFGASVEKLGLRGLDIEAIGPAAGLAVVSDGKIRNVTVEGRIKGATAGGLVAEMRHGAISLSFVSAEVIASNFAGGLVAMAGQNNANQSQIDHSKFEGSVAGSVTGGIVGQAMYETRIEGTNAIIFTKTNGTAGGLVGRLGCGARLDNSFAEGQLEGAGIKGGMIGVLADAKAFDGYSTVFIDTAGASRGGAIGEIRNQEINGDGNFVCTGSRQPPPRSEQSGLYYDRVLASNGGAAGTGLSTAQLRDASRFPAAWFAPAGGFHIFPGYMPSIRTGLPRGP